jgi:hypothetical protein
MVAQERDYSPDDVKDIDCTSSWHGSCRLPGKSLPARVPGLQHSRNIAAPATFRPT